MLVRSDAIFPTLYQIRQQGLFTTPVAYATAHVAALVIKNFPLESAGVFPPEALPLETRRAILSGIRKHKVKIFHKVSLRKPIEDEELL